MGLEFLKRVWIAALVVGVVVFAFTAVYFEVTFALGILVGCLWGVANFIALTALLTAVVRPDSINRKRAYIFAAIKFPVIYAAGYLILRTEYLEPAALLLGFSLLFSVILLKALGRAFLRLDALGNDSLTRSNPRGFERPLPKGEVNKLVVRDEIISHT